MVWKFGSVLVRVAGRDDVSLGGAAGELTGGFLIGLRHHRAHTLNAQATLFPRSWEIRGYSCARIGFTGAVRARYLDKRPRLCPLREFGGRYTR